MKAVVLAGGLGARIGEETAIRSKPMVENGGKPIPWHVMKMYSHHGQESLMRLAEDDQLMAFEHDGFWQSMDTLRDKHLPEELWTSGKRPWKK
jgi:NDP-sugar pyrophosphorylase family protein